MKRILVAVGEDGFANQVVEAAAQVAKATHSALTVCHVMPEELYQDIHMKHLKDNTGERFVLYHAEQRANSAAAHAAEALETQDVRFETRGVVGAPSREIVALARELGADLIVMGFEGLHGLGKVRALGSVSRDVMERTTIPVMIVPLPVELHEEVTESEHLVATS